MKWILFVPLSLIFSFTACADNTQNVQYLNEDWPTLAECKECMTFQTGDMKLLIDKDKIISINVLNLSSPSINLLFTNENNGNTYDIGVLVLDEKKTTGGLREHGYFKRLSVESLEQFFIALGEPNPDKEALALSRDIMGINNASAYVRIKGKDASAYWIKSNDINNQKMFIVSNKSSHTYLIAGNLDKNIVSEFLSKINF